MTKYIVHLYREMRLSYTDIDAETPEAAAAIAAGKPTDTADTVEDCDCQNLAARVDMAGDEDYSHSVTIDFEPERIRHAAARLLAALEACELQLRDYIIRWHHDHTGRCSVEIESAWEHASTAIAEAKTAGIPSDLIPTKLPSRFEIEHHPLQDPDRADVLVDGRFEVAIERTETGLLIRIYPRTDGQLWDDPFTTFEVEEAEILALEKEIGQ